MGFFFLFCSVIFLIAPFDDGDVESKEEQPIAGRSAMLIDGDTKIVIPYTPPLSRSFHETVRIASTHYKWESFDDLKTPSKAIKLSSKFGPMKYAAGSKGFSGLKSLTLELEEPYRVIADDSSGTFVTRVPDESSLLDPMKALWLTIKLMHSESK